MIICDKIVGICGKSDAPPLNSVISEFRNSHVTTPNSEILTCENDLEITPEIHSQSLPASQDLLHFLPLPQVYFIELSLT